MLTRIDRNSIICDDIKTSTGEKYLTSDAVFNAQALAETAAVNAIEAANDARNTADTIKANAIEITNEVVSEIKQETFNAQALAETAALEAIDAKSKSVEIKNEFDIYRNNGCVYSGDIILNGSKLLLANGASVELFTGEELPSPGGSGGDSYPLPEEPIDTSDFATLSGNNEFSGNNNFAGNLTLDGNSIVTKNIADETYLKVNGSNKIAGHIHVDNSSLKTFTIGYPWENKIGALLSLRGVNYETSGQEGTFALAAINGGNEKFLVGYPSGKLTWAGKEVVTANFLNNINWDSDITKDPYIGIDNSKVSGPYIYFRRGDSTTSAGSLELSARNATSTSCTLKLNVDGTLTWCGKKVITENIPFGFPDYASVVRIEYESGQEFVAPDNGWIGTSVNAELTNDNILVRFLIDGTRIHTITQGHYDSFIIPIAKNSIFKGITSSDSNTIEAMSYIDWFPAKK